MLSVIIVNYNVRAFLEQCLYSLQAALKGIEAEVWVVDNASSDDSVAFLQPLFKQVKWIKNPINEGFGKANNRALALATGKFVLFLNPDTLLPEDCLEKCLQFMHAQKDAGALGIKMLDGRGKFLPESKRAFPGPVTSFCKLVGLAALFPKSRFFARYYLGNLSPDNNHPVDVLAGAFMLVNKQVLDITGGFDERFFMYGEDIDLSYRINKTLLPGGVGHWKNYYFAEAPIIHFKGESTKKGSLNYVLMFYKAMVQFVKKHYASGRANIFITFIYIAIAGRALLSVSGRIIKLAALPFKKLFKHGPGVKSIVVVGNTENFAAIEKLYRAYHKQDQLLGRLGVSDKDTGAIMTWQQWKKKPETLPVKEIIFCSCPAFSMAEIISELEPSLPAGFRFYATGSSSIVGSEDSNASGETLAVGNQAG